MKPVQPMQSPAQTAALLKLALANKHGSTPYATRLRQEAALLLGGDATTADPKDLDETTRITPNPISPTDPISVDEGTRNAND